MKKWMTCLLLFVVAVSANAQFEKGKKYVGASLSGLSLSYSSGEKFRFGLDADTGYFIADNLMLKGNLNYAHTKAVDEISIGAGARYYFEQNGIFLGAGAEYSHFTPNNNDLRIPVEVGYAFFVNKNITIEPAVYYKMSLADFSDNSTVGLKIGFGFYF